MNLEVLVSTMNMKDLRLINDMNIKSDAIIVNQSDKFEKKEFINEEKNTIKIYSFDERGIGISRNNALMRATADICVFADDDVIYVDNYKKKIMDEFNRNKDADIILFNVESLNKDRPTCKIKKNHKVKMINCLRYGAVNIAFRREKIINSNIWFSVLFGGGAKYSAGEDSLFISECLKKGLNIYASTEKIAYVKQEDSTWFNGYTDKYFIDKGVFFSALSPKSSDLLILQFAIRKYNLYKEYKSIFEVVRLMKSGKKDFIKGVNI